MGQSQEDLVRGYPEGSWGSITITHVVEHERLESGGAIRNAVRTAKPEGPFLVLNGDIYVDFDLQAALAAHHRTNARLTLALCPVIDPSPFGVAIVDSNSQITGFVEKPPPGTAASDLVNAGVWLFDPSLVQEIPPGAVRVEETLFPSLVGRRENVLGYCFEGLWADLGTPARYLELSQSLVKRSGAPLLGRAVQVAEDANIEGSAIGAGSSVAEGAHVTGSVLWEDVRVEAGARIKDSVLANGVTIGAGAVVSGAVIGQGANVTVGAQVQQGELLEPGEQRG
tara:strand:- start:933 stop:1781 length:849 start_codon:yes stop_codon:yes gene_type:complete